jgi:hypothetical protein
VQQLRNDAVLSRALKTILAWEGQPTDSQDIAVSMAPGIKLTPTFGPDTWAFPDGFRGWMFIAVEMISPGFDVGDMVDLWWSVQEALYPPNPANLEPSPAQQFQLELRHLGAYTGQIEFSQPAADPAPADQKQFAIGQMRVEIRLYVNF